MSSVNGSPLQHSCSLVDPAAHCHTDSHPHCPHTAKARHPNDSHLYSSSTCSPGAGGHAQGLAACARGSAPWQPWQTVSVLHMAQRQAALHHPEASRPPPWCGRWTPLGDILGIPHLVIDRHACSPSQTPLHQHGRQCGPGPTTWVWTGSTG